MPEKFMAENNRGNGKGKSLEGLGLDANKRPLERGQLPEVEPMALPENTSEPFDDDEFDVAVPFSNLPSTPEADARASGLMEIAENRQAGQNPHEIDNKIEQVLRNPTLTSDSRAMSKVIRALNNLN